MPRPESSIWGNILTCVEIGLHVYGIIAEKNGGIAVDADYAEETLSEEALQVGEKHGEHIYYDDVKSIVPAYELLQQDAITNSRFKERCGSPEQLAEEGKFFAPEYFGEYDPPTESPWGAVLQNQPIHNGIYYLESDGEWRLAVHQTIGKHCLSDMAHQLAQEQGDYLYYPLDSCAIPIYELSASHPAVAEQVVSDDSLAHTLCEDHPTYVAMHNLHTDGWGHIHDCAAPKSLFLQFQLDLAADQDEQGHLSHDHSTTPLEAKEPDEFFEPTGELEL